MEQGSDNHNNPKSIIESIRSWYRALPDKKRYLEFFTAFLTIPVLLTVLLSNVNNLQNKKDASTPTPLSTIAVNPTTQPSPTASAGEAPTATATPGPECVQQVGPIDISYPLEGDTVTGDPVCLDISRTSQNYCSVVWSYRINGGAWSDYTDKSICMYGLTAGTKNLELRVKSIVSTDTTVLKRTFTVAGDITPTPTSATSSAGVN
jgi:hypothetical protein